MNPSKSKGRSSDSGKPRIVTLKVRNYRVLHDIELRNLTSLTTLLGPNGSGKSTLFDVFAFLAECFGEGLRRAWDKRGRFKELRSRGQDGPIVIELQYKETNESPLITYHLAIDERPTGPVVAEEWLSWRRLDPAKGQPFRFLDYKMGKGKAVSGENPDESDKRISIQLRSPELLAVNTLGQFDEHPRVASLREFITGWYVSYLSADATRGIPEAGPQERLSRTGDNLPNVIQYLKERHPKRLERIFNVLATRVPRLERVLAEPMEDGRLLLQIKDAPFEKPVLAKFASDGTLKMLAYLVVLHDPSPPLFIGIEEPENFLHPKLLTELAEECHKTTERSQLLVTTHSPFFVNGLRPDEVWVLGRGAAGFAQIQRCSEMVSIPGLVQEGAQLGYLWMENYFKFGEPVKISSGQ